MSYSVREAKRGDLDEILELELENFDPLAQAPEDLVRERFEKYPEGFFIVQDNSHPVGYIFVAPYRNIWDDNRKITSHRDLILPSGYIDKESDIIQFISIAVRKEHRVTRLSRNGYLGESPSQLLLTSAVEHAMERGADQIYVLAVTPQGNSILENSGFNRYREIELNGDQEVNLWRYDLENDGHYLIKGIRNYYRSKLSSQLVQDHVSTSLFDPLHLE